MPLVLGNFKIDQKLDDDSVYEIPPNTVIVGKDGSVQTVSVQSQSSTQTDPDAGVGAETGAAPAITSDAEGADTAEEVPDPEEQAGVGVSADVATDTEDVVYEWWSTAELMSYNIEFALKSRWESIGSKMLMDGLSVVSSLTEVGDKLKNLFGVGPNAPALQLGENGVGNQPDGAAPGSSEVPPANLAPSANRDEKVGVLLDYARQFIGTPYPRNPKTGKLDPAYHNMPKTMDCSGFVQYVFKNALGINLAHHCGEQSEAGTRINLSELLPGDLVFYGKLHTHGGYKAHPSHVMLYVGGGQVQGNGDPNDIYSINYRTGERGALYGVRIIY